MSNITDLIKDLRNKTGAGFLDCKNALSENNNEIDYAILGKREGSRITEIHAARSDDIVQYLVSHFQSHGANQLVKNFRMEEFISQEWSFEWPE